MVTTLFALRGEQCRPFYWWLAANCGSLFLAAPNLTRLMCLMRWWSAETDKFLDAIVLSRDGCRRHRMALSAVRRAKGEVRSASAKKN